jgi:hypothetical protein
VAEPHHAPSPARRDDSATERHRALTSTLVRNNQQRNGVLTGPAPSEMGADIERLAYPLAHRQYERVTPSKNGPSWDPSEHDGRRYLTLVGREIPHLAERNAFRRSRSRNEVDRHIEGRRVGLPLNRRDLATDRQVATGGAARVRHCAKLAGFPAVTVDEQETRAGGRLSWADATAV